MSDSSKLGRKFLEGMAKLRLWKPAVLFCQAQRLVESGSNTFEQATKLLQRTIQLAPSWAAPHMLLAHIAELQDCKDEQEQHLWMTLRYKPNHEQAEAQLMKLRAWRHEPVMRAWHLYYSGQPAQAVVAFHEALKLVGKRVAANATAEIHSGIGWSWHAQQSWDRGAESFHQAVQEDSQLAHAWKGLGLCHYHMHQLPQAEAAFDRALQRNAQAVDVVALLGWCAYAADDFNCALGRFEAALDQNPLLGDAWWGVAWCQWRNRDTEAAGHALMQARKWAPDHPSAAKAAAIFQQDPAYQDILQPDAASGASSKGSDHSASNPLWDALHALQVGELDRAWTLLQGEGITQSPAWQVELLRGRVQRARNHEVAALRHLHAARTAAPQRADAAHELSRYLDQLNRSAEAQDLLGEYPDHLRSA